MDINETFPDWKETARNKEVTHWKNKYKRTVRLCKAIWEYQDYIVEIKGHLSVDDDLGASELWNELDYSVQQLLITAPLHGGPFTTEEVKKIKELWEISENELSGERK